MAFSKNVVILQGEYSCPKLQNPLFQKAEEKYVPGEKVPFRADEGGGTIPENATIAKAEDLFPDDDNNKGLLYPREILETETLNDRENEEFGDY